MKQSAIESGRVDGPRLSLWCVVTQYSSQVIQVRMSDMYPGHCKHWRKGRERMIRDMTQLGASWRRLLKITGLPLPITEYVIQFV